MNDETDLESLVREHISAKRSAISPPAEFHGSIIRRLKQGPRSPFRTRPLRQLALATALLAFAALLAVGFSLLRAARDSSNSGQATPLPTPLLGIPLRLVSIHMVTSTVGWADGRLQDRAGVFRTTDGGATWRQVIVPASGQVPYFVDQSHGWSLQVTSGALNGSASRAVVLRTRDGGQTWEEGEPFTIERAGGDIRFIDLEHGWLVVFLPGGSGQSAEAIYRTIDGGVHWEKVAVSPSIPVQPTRGSLPFLCLKNGVSFVNASTGWATGTCPGHGPFFYRSDDGGRTWYQQPLPAPPDEAQVLSSCTCGTSLPQFVSSQTGFVLVGGQHPILYVTKDGGTTWVPSKLPVGIVVSEVVFSDPNNGWFIGSKVEPDQTTSLYTTHDSGKTWAPVTPSQDLRSTVIRFVTARDGWALSTDASRPRLLRTADGGWTWAELEPVALKG